MLKNKKTVYFCQECGYESAKWMGQCPACKAWNTFVEETVSSKKSASSNAKISQKKTEPVILRDISLSADERQSCGIGELDRVLGGGIVPGSLVLVGGDPGIGKSTLLLQVCRNLSSQGASVLYISGEESLRQIKLRADRLQTPPKRQSDRLSFLSYKTEYILSQSTAILNKYFEVRQKSHFAQINE